MLWHFSDETGSSRCTISTKDNFFWRIYCDFTVFQLHSSYLNVFFTSFAHELSPQIKIKGNKFGRYVDQGMHHQYVLLTMQFKKDRCRYKKILTIAWDNALFSKIARHLILQEQVYTTTNMQSISTNVLWQQQHEPKMEPGSRHVIYFALKGMWR